MTDFILCLPVFIFLFITIPIKAIHPVIIETKLGDIEGSEFFHFSRKIRSFLGIPYAEPPIEDRRFKVPIVKRKWRGIMNATKLSNSCYQTRDNYNTSFWGSEMWNANTEISEDCLYLNIWAPANAYNLTVMVWIHGGGFYAGSSSLKMYDGKTLAATQNVIIVNINYRLGPFGFLYFDHPSAPGNMGLLDQQLALHWIRENIVSFGGNPGKICVFGESAGAASIAAHLIAPGSDGLFRNAILQSGTIENQWAISSPYRAVQKSRMLVELVGCNKTTIEMSLSCLRALPASQILKSTWNISLSFLEFPFVIVSRDANFFGHIDARVAVHEGNFNRNVNIMIGMNKDEGTFWNIYNLPEYFDKLTPPELSRIEFESLIDRVFSIHPDIIRSAAKYIYSDPNCTDHGRKTRYFANRMNQIVGDYFYSCDSLRFVDQLHSLSFLRIFVYYFAQSSSGNPWPKWTGAMHGYEIEFVFGVPLISKNFKRREQIFSRKMMQFWTSFAKNGIPRLHETKNSEIWPEYSIENQYRWMQLRSGSNIRAIKALKSIECKFWENVKNSEYTAYLTQEYSANPASYNENFQFLFLFIFFFSPFRIFPVYFYFPGF